MLIFSELQYFPSVDLFPISSQKKGTGIVLYLFVGFWLGNSETFGTGRDADADADAGRRRRLRDGGAAALHGREMGQKFALLRRSALPRSGEKNQQKQIHPNPIESIL